MSGWYEYRGVGYKSWEFSLGNNIMIALIPAPPKDLLLPAVL